MQSIWNLLLPWLSLAFVLATISWILFRALYRSDEPARLAWRWIASACLIGGTLLFLVKGIGFGGGGSLLGSFAVALILAGSTAVCGILLGILWAPSIGSWLSRPLVGLFDGGGQEIKPEPCYSAAASRRNRGDYHAAVAEVQRQLDAFPGDLPGTLLLADILALNLHDPGTAIQTIEAWIEEFGSSSPRLPAAFHQIAELHLHQGNPSGARTALNCIVAQFPNTEAAHLAAQRIAHLASADMLAEKIEPRRLRIGPYPTHPGWQPRSNVDGTPMDSSIDPASAILECARHLEQFPADDEAREKLARLYAEHDRHMDRARPELERLIQQPGVSARQIVRWLNLLADLELQIVGDESAARVTLQRIVDRLPRGAAAEAARHRLACLKLELRRNQTPRGFRLGHDNTPD